MFLRKIIPPSVSAVVDLEAVPDVAVAASVTVEPASSDDWEVIERQADHMEEQILNQVPSRRHATPTPPHAAELAFAALQPYVH